MKRVWRVVAVVMIGLLAAGVSYSATSVLTGPGGRPVEPIELDRQPVVGVTSLPNPEATILPTDPESPPVVSKSVPATSPPSNQPPDPGDDDDDGPATTNDLGTDNTDNTVAEETENTDNTIDD